MKRFVDLKTVVVFLTMLVLAFVIVVPNAMATERLKGYLLITAIEGPAVQIDGYVLDFPTEQWGKGYIGILLSSGDQMKILPKQEVSGRFRLTSGELSRYAGWEYTITLYGHEADSSGMSRVLATNVGVIR